MLRSLAMREPVAALLALALAGCDCGPGGAGGDLDAGGDASPDSMDAGPPCDAQAHPVPEACYTGPTETRNVGLCHDGQRSCVDGAWSGCVNELLPSDPSLCVDADCDGAIDSEPECAPCGAGLCVGAEGRRGFEDIVLEGLVPCPDGSGCVTLAPGTGTGAVRAIFQGRDCMSSMWMELDAVLDLPEGATASAEYHGGGSCAEMEDAEWSALIGPQGGDLWTFPDTDERPYVEVRITLAATGDAPILEGLCLRCLIGM